MPSGAERPPETAAEHDGPAENTSLASAVPIALLGAYAAAFAAWVLWGGGTSHQRTVISDVAFLPVDLAAVACAVRAMRHPVLSPRARRGWGLIAAALVAWTIGDGVWCWLEVVRDQSPFPSAADAFYLAFYPLVLGGVALVTPAHFDGGARLRFVLDALTVTLVAAAAVWLIAIGPTMEEPQSLLARMLNVAYPAGDVLIVFGIAAILLRRPPPSTAGALRLLMVGALLFVGADLVYARMSLAGTYQGGDLPDALWMAALATFAVAGYVQHRIATRRGVAPSHAAVSRVSLIPYLAVPLGLGLLLADVPGGGSELVVLVVAAFLIWALVSVRQVLALRDNARLNRELHRLTTDLERALDETRTALAVANDERERGQRFLADAAHQLRTPITGLRASAEMLLRGAPPGTAERLLLTIGQESTRAGQIIADLLTLAHLDQDPSLQRMPTDLVALCEREAAHARALVVGLNVEVACPEPAVEPLAVDPEAVRRIVANLLDNARRHAQRSITLTVHTSRSGVDVEVRDDGPGLDPASAEAVFDRFVALDGQRGSGLGLAIARSYARAHNGDLTYQDGAFVLSLPVGTVGAEN